MLLVLNGTCADGNIRQQVRQITVVFRIEHLVCAGQTSLLNCTGMQLTNGDQTLEHILFLFRIRLVYHALIAFAGGAGLVGVDTRDQDQLICYLFLYLCQTVHVVQNCVLTVGRARSDNQQLFV